jgi:hypothetical protein
MESKNNQTSQISSGAALKLKLTSKTLHKTTSLLGETPESFGTLKH